MIRVAAITSGKHAPSARFRVRQYIEPLQRVGIDVREYFPPINKFSGLPGLPAVLRQKYLISLTAMWEGIKLLSRVPGVIGSWQAQITWLQKEISRGCVTFEPVVRSPYVFDVDDAIWLRPPFGRAAAIRIARNAHVILAGNAFIAEWFSRFNKNLQIVPTAIDTERFVPRESQNSSKDRPFVVGWTGTSGNYSYLYEIEAALRRFLEDAPDAQLLVIADQPPAFKRIQPEKVRFIRWSPDIEAKAIRQMDVGLMPLRQSQWTQAKCSFKMLQYMSSGLPVVVSPVGMNQDILAMGEIGFAAITGADWYDCLFELYRNRDLAFKFGVTGRSVSERHFSRNVVSARLAEMFKNLC